MNKALLLTLMVLGYSDPFFGGSDEPIVPIATQITMSPASLNFGALGDTATIAATVKDQNGGAMSSAAVTWATSDAAIATVSSAGLVTSVAKGSATITASGGGLSATVSVEVAVDNFSLAANSVTVVCTNAAVGDNRRGGRHPSYTPSGRKLRSGRLLLEMTRP